MTDTIIKNAGNSRSIRSVPNLKQMVHELDDLLDLLISPDGLPIDLGPINPAGCEVVGNNLNKETMLSDETAALYPELPENPIPDNVFALLGPMITDAQQSADEKTKIATGTYAGNGTTNTVYLPFKAKAVIIGRYGMIDGSRETGGIAIDGYDTGTNNAKAVLLSIKGAYFQVYPSVNNTNYGMNSSGNIYYYLAFA